MNWPVFLLNPKRFSEAWEVVETMPEAAKNELKGLECAGYAKEGLGLDDEAAAYADRMLSSNENYPAALNLKGVLAYKKGEKEKAQIISRKPSTLIRVMEKPIPTLAFSTGAWIKKMKRLRICKRVLSYPQPCRMSVRFIIPLYLPWAYSVTRKPTSGKPVRLYPNNKNLAFLYIDILIQQGKFDSAMIKDRRRARFVWP